MNYTDTLQKMIDLGAAKVALLHNKPGASAAGSVLAGAYVGLAIVLILSLGAWVPDAWQRLVMGCTFGLALLLIVFAGAELFTGYTLYLSLAWSAGRIRGTDAFLAAMWCWLGNVAGSVLVATLFVGTGANGLLNGENTLLFKIFHYKTQASVWVLLSKAILCNWLVCLALWMASRLHSEAAKCIVIAWCLLAFIASGYEHSVANMTVLSLGLMGSAHALQDLSSVAYNLFWISLGNVVGGAVMVGLFYRWANGGLPAQPVDEFV
jgi:nitrite transporter